MAAWGPQKQSGEVNSGEGIIVQRAIGEIRSILDCSEPRSVQREGVENPARTTGYQKGEIGSTRHCPPILSPLLLSGPCSPSCSQLELAVGSQVEEGQHGWG